MPSMLRHHEDELLRRLDAVAWEGVVQIQWWELKAWYQIDVMDEDVWRDLSERFDEATGNAGYELYAYEGDTCLTLIHSDGLKRLSEKFDDGGAAAADRPTSVPATKPK